jgi:hypothetical protein
MPVTTTGLEHAANGVGSCDNFAVLVARKKRDELAEHRDKGGG